VLISLADENFVADALPPSGLDTLRACAIERLANTDAMMRGDDSIYCRKAWCKEMPNE